jgi:hypothetical protein
VSRQPHRRRAKQCFASVISAQKHAAAEAAVIVFPTGLSSHAGQYGYAHHQKVISTEYSLLI